MEALGLSLAVDRDDASSPASGAVEIVDIGAIARPRGGRHGQGTLRAALQSRGGARDPGGSRWNVLRLRRSAARGPGCISAVA